jgi:hypothetical protein
MGFRATTVKTKIQPSEVLHHKFYPPSKSKHSPYTPTIRVRLGHLQMQATLTKCLCGTLKLSQRGLAQKRHKQGDIDLQNPSKGPRHCPWSFLAVHPNNPSLKAHDVKAEDQSEMPYQKKAMQTKTPHSTLVPKLTIDDARDMFSRAPWLHLEKKWWKWRNCITWMQRTRSSHFLGKMRMTHVKKC